MTLAGAEALNPNKPKPTKYNRHAVISLLIIEKDERYV